MASLSKPLFIVVEGLDGSGKTTQLELLKERLTKAGHDVHLTAEPTDFLPTGQLIRDILEHRTKADQRTIAALYAADRLEHLLHPHSGVLDRLAAGQTVVASRYYFSSLAYQSEYASMEWVAALNSQARSLLQADITLFLDLPPEKSVERLAKSRDQVELFDSLEKLTKVRADFRKAFDYWGEGEKVVVIDASCPIADVAEEIWGALEAFSLNH